MKKIYALLVVLLLIGLSLLSRFEIEFGTVGGDDITTVNCWGINGCLEQKKNGEEVVSVYKYRIFENLNSLVSDIQIRDNVRMCYEDGMRYVSSEYHPEVTCREDEKKVLVGPSSESINFDQLKKISRLVPFPV